MSTPHDRHSYDAEEQAALAALGALPAEELLAFEQHIGGGCAQCQREFEVARRVASLLLLATPSVEPRAALRQRVIERVRAEKQVVAPPSQAHGATAEPKQSWKSWKESAVSNTQLHTVVANAGYWEPSGFIGVTVRKLHVDNARREATMLVRMEPGASYPRHIHRGAEQCLVLDGDLHVGEDLVLNGGDFQFAPAESIHAVQFTEAGCTLLIISSMSDDLLDV